MPLNLRFRRITAVLSLCALVVACGDAGEGADNGDNQDNANQTNDGGDNDNDDNDRSDDFLDDPQDDCQEAIDRAASFEVPLPDGADTGVVPDLTRVEDELWVTYLASVDVGDDSANKAHLVRLECNGEAIDEPVQLGNDVEFDDSPPALDTDGSIVYAVWSDAVETEEEDIESRLQGMTFDSDGSAHSDDPFTIEFDIDGERMTDLDGPDVAVDHQGNAGVVAVESAGFGSHPIFQRIDEVGEPVGDGFYLDEDDDGAGPTITRRDDNHLFFAYTGEGVMHGTIRPDGESVDEGPESAEPAVGSGNDPGAVAVSNNRAGGNTWMAYTLGGSANNTARVRTGMFVGLRDGESTSVDERFSQLAAVTASDNGGAKAWASADDEQGTIHFRRFQGGGLDTSHAGPVIDEHDEDLAIGGPDIVWLVDEIFVAVWPEEDGLVGRTLDFDREEE